MTTLPPRGIMLAIAAKLRRELDLPSGYVVDVDQKTDCIIIKNDRLGFAVTQKYVADHPYAYFPPIAEQLAALKVATETGVMDPLSKTIDQLVAEREGSSTKFD